MQQRGEEAPARTPAALVRKEGVRDLTGTDFSSPASYFTDGDSEAESCSFIQHTLITSPLGMDPDLLCPCRAHNTSCLSPYLEVHMQPIRLHLALPDTSQSSVSIWGLPCPRLRKRQDYKYRHDHLPVCLPAPPGPPKHTNSVERAPWPCQCSINACPLSAPLPSPQAPLPSPATPGSGPQGRLLDQGTQKLLSPPTSPSQAQSSDTHCPDLQAPTDLKAVATLDAGHMGGAALGHLCPRGDRHLPPAWPMPAGRGLEWGQA